MMKGGVKQSAASLSCGRKSIPPEALIPQGSPAPGNSRAASYPARADAAFKAAPDLYKNLRSGPRISNMAASPLSVAYRGHPSHLSLTSHHSQASDPQQDLTGISLQE